MRVGNHRWRRSRELSVVAVHNFRVEVRPVTRLTEVEIGEWITPRNKGRLYQVQAFDGEYNVVLHRYPLTEHVVITRSLMTLYKTWRPAYQKDWIRERAAHPEVSDSHA